MDTEPFGRPRVPAGQLDPAPSLPPVAPQEAGYPPSGYPPSGYPPSGYPPSGDPSTGYPTPGWQPGLTPDPRRAPRRRRSWPGVLALVLVVGLIGGFGYQTWRLEQVSSSLARANERLDQLAQGQTYAGERLDALEGRAGELERLAGEAFDPEEIAAAVLPSVFMVIAGEFTGTAFAVGPAASEGGSNLLTNYHVIEQVWGQGGRQVALERSDQRYTAEIVDVDPESDVAWLRTETSFAGLATTDNEVRSGQPIVAVGAPLGLTDTVTTGVVSTPEQRLPDGSGPWIQFDAAVNPGNSGGPVINSDQQVVGIATAKRQEAEGPGFAVPIEVACDQFDVC